MRAIIFPGQGSQAIGMGKELYNTFSEAKEVFQEVDETLKQKLSQLIFSGNIEELTKTSNTQPAIMTVSIAALRVIQKQSGKSIDELCKYIAGHSLGEYSAYCAAGSFTISDTAKLLKVRGEAMQNSDPEGRGAMLALIGTNIEQAEKLCIAVQDFGLCQIANDNGAEQVVLSGVSTAIEKAMELASQFNIRRHIRLSVSSAFHSVLMESVKETMHSALEKVDIKKPKVEVIANLSAKSVLELDEIRLSLTEQITNRVRWRETMEFIINQNITHFIEIGPGKVLSGIAKKFANDLQTASISTPNDIEKLLGYI